MTTSDVVSIPVLPVADIHKATGWYEKALDLTTAFLHEGDQEGEATNYAVLRRGDFVVHLILDEPPPYELPWTKTGTGYLYLKVGDVDKMFNDMESRGVDITRGLETENWGARGFNMKDPSGNAIHIEQR